MIEEINLRSKPLGIFPGFSGRGGGAWGSLHPRGVRIRFSVLETERFDNIASQMGTGTARREKLRGPSKWSDSSSVREFNLPWSSN